MKTSETTMTPRQAATELQVRLDYLYKLLWDETIPAHKVDGRWVLDRRDVEAYQASRKVWLVDRKAVEARKEVA